MTSQTDLRADVELDQIDRNLFVQVTDRKREIKRDEKEQTRQLKQAVV